MTLTLTGEVIAKVRESRPHEYLRVIAATLPKRLETEGADRPLEKLLRLSRWRMARWCREASVHKAGELRSKSQAP